MCKGEGRTGGAALSPWKHGYEERECTMWVEQSSDRGQVGRRGVTPWHDKHDASRLTSRLAVRVGNPSHSYHPDGFLTGDRSPGSGQCNSCNTLCHCPGAVGSATPTIYCLTS